MAIGTLAGLTGEAAHRLEGFGERVRGLLAATPVVHTPPPLARSQAPGPSQARQAVAGGQHPVRFTAPTVRHNMLAGCIVVLAGLLLLTLAAGGTATPQALLVPPERRPAPARRPRAPPVIALCVLRH